MRKPGARGLCNLAHLDEKVCQTQLFELPPKSIDRTLVLRTAIVSRYGGKQLCSAMCVFLPKQKNPGLWFSKQTMQGVVFPNKQMGRCVFVFSSFFSEEQNTTQSDGLCFFSPQRGMPAPSRRRSQSPRRRPILRQGSEKMPTPPCHVLKNTVYVSRFSKRNHMYCWLFEGSLVDIASELILGKYIPCWRVGESLSPVHMLYLFPQGA